MCVYVYGNTIGSAIDLMLRIYERVDHVQVIRR